MQTTRLTPRGERLIALIAVLAFVALMALAGTVDAAPLR